VAHYAETKSVQGGCDWWLALREKLAHQPEGECDQKIAHNYERDSSLAEWHGWHACRRGLGSNLYRLGVPDMVIQRILRHANVSTTTGYYIKTGADDVREAMTKFENSIPKSELDTIFGHLNRNRLGVCD
jgi:integrase